MNRLSFLILILVLTSCTQPQKVEITSFQECVDAGFPMMKSYPAKCNDGTQTFVQDIGNALELRDRIRVTSPRVGERVTFPLTITGEARGSWYFEADFPISIVVDGTVIAQSYASALDEWMTEEFVPFEGQIDASPEAKSGVILLHYSNASGEKSRDAALRIPVLFD